MESWSLLVALLLGLGVLQLMGLVTEGVLESPDRSWLFSVFAAMLVAFSLTAVGTAEARMGGSFGSRGMRTVTPPTERLMARLMQRLSRPARRRWRPRRPRCR